MADSKNTDIIFSEDIIYFAVMAAALFLLYLPVINGYYLWHDDFSVYAWSKKDYWGHPIFGYLNQLGRPGGAFFLVLLTRPVNTLSDGNWVRGVLVLLTLVTAFLFFKLLPRLVSQTQTRPDYSLPGKKAYFLLVLFIFSLPPFNTYIAYLSNGPDIVGIFFSVLGVFFLFRFVFEPEAPFKRTSAVLSYLFLFGSLITYPPSAMLGYCLLGMILLFLSYGDFCFYWKRLLKFSILLSLPVILYAVSIKLFYINPQGDAYGMGFENDFAFKFKWLIDKVFFTVLNFWNIYPTKTLPVIFFIIIASGILIETLQVFTHPRNDRPGRTVLFLFGKYLVILVLIVASISPNFFSLSGRSLTYRSMSIIFIFGSILCFFFLWKILNLFRDLRYKDIRLSPHLMIFLLFVQCGVSFYGAHQNLNRIAFSASVELRYIKSRLLAEDLNKYTRIHLIRPMPKYMFSFTEPYSRNDEFAMAITGAPQYAAPIMLAMLKEAGVKIDSVHHRPWGMEINQWKVSHSTPDELEKLKFTEPTLYIDMNQLTHFY